MRCSLFSHRSSGGTTWMKAAAMLRPRNHGSLLVVVVAAGVTAAVAGARAQTPTPAAPVAGPTAPPNVAPAAPAGPQSGVLAPANTATTKRDIAAVRFAKPPVIDGDIGDACWNEAARADGFTDAVRGDRVPDQTVAFLGYDDSHIYVAFRCQDSVPGGIVGRETKRGTRFRGEDTVAVALDPFHTHRFADRSFFVVNPLGTQFARLSGGRGSKLEWEGAWRAAAKRDDTGWTAEIAVPWSILNYPATRGPATLGINFDRYQQRTNTHSWWSNLGQNEDQTLDGRWQNVLLPRFRPHFSLLPYVAPRYGDTGNTANNGNARVRFGLDGRAALSPTLTLIGTVNPDFENVEQSVESVDFSYGERYVPDRRPFFQEGQDVYQAGGVAGQFFYSSRVPAFDTGLNLYGKLSPRDTLGLLAAYDAGNQMDWLLRGRRELSDTASVNFGLINRDARPAPPALPTDPSAPDPAPPAPQLRSNRVLVLGQNWRPHRSWDLDASWAGSWFNGRRTGDTANVFLDYHDRGWYAALAPYYVAPGFRDDLGFIPFTGYRGVRGNVFYEHDPRAGPLRSWYAGGSVNHSDRYEGGVFRRERRANAGLHTRASDLRLNLSWNGGRFAASTAPDAQAFNDSVWSLYVQGRASDPFHTYGLGYSWGRRADAAYALLTPYVTWRFGAKLTLGASSEILRHTENRAQHILTFGYDFSPRQGLGGRIILADDNDSNTGTSGYLAYRQSGYGGTETFLILGDPNARKNFAQRVALKIVWSL